MTSYYVGDLHGCFKQFKNLIRIIKFNPKTDHLYLTGDLVNKGTQSLELMNYLYSIDKNVTTVLGNHDFNLLAAYFDVKPWSKIPHTMQKLLNDKNIEKYITWIRKKSLLHINHSEKIILTHSGIYPGWTLKDAIKMSDQVSKKMKSDQIKNFIKTLWSNEPSSWKENFTPKEKMIFAVNAFTRMRFLNKNLSLNLDVSSDAFHNDNIKPWFKYNSRYKNNLKIIFGHWAALGFYKNKNYICLDSGCAWGNKLTAIKVNKHYLTKYQVKC